MIHALSSRAASLLRQPALAHLATLNEDGSPHSAPVWVDTDGTHVIINTCVGFLKTRNMERDPRVALSVASLEDPLRHLSVTGRVVEITTEGADAHIDALA